MKVLFVSPEVSPLARTGGLGDVVGALPSALRNTGLDIRILCPLHRGALKGLESKRLEGSLRFRVGSRRRSCRVVETCLPRTDVPVYLLEHKGLFNRPGLYAGPRGDYQDNAERSLVLCRAALELQVVTGWSPDVYHAHDWMAAALPAYLNAASVIENRTPSASVLTIHNLEHQGIFSSEAFALSRLPNSYFRADGFEHYGRLNLLKGGIQHADKITTVSPTYAEEIRSELHGHALHPSLDFRAADLVGILNGIDEDAWNPRDDLALPKPFCPDTVETGKQACRTALSKEVGLPHISSLPLFGAVSRLYWQKGLDLLAKALPKLLERSDLQLILLGSGDPALEKKFSNLAKRFPKKIAVRIGFDDDLARRIFAASDFFVMPSRFEPCGLAQQYAMRYGALPVARRTGGLADTVRDPKEYPQAANGFLFDKTTETSLAMALRQAAKIHAKPETLARMRRNAMDRKASWKDASDRYAEVYRWALETRGKRLARSSDDPCG